jgi:hypothetical protein
MRALVAAVVFAWLLFGLAATIPAAAETDMPPADYFSCIAGRNPNPQCAKWTKVPFGVAWAQRLRGFKTIAQLRRAAGSPGYSVREADGRELISWSSEPPSHTGGGWMLATILPGGYIGVAITLIDGPSIVLNNCGGFICDDCRPPIDITGCLPPAQ